MIQASSLSWFQKRGRARSTLADGMVPSWLAIGNYKMFQGNSYSNLRSELPVDPEKEPHGSYGTDAIDIDILVGPA